MRPLRIRAQKSKEAKAELRDEIRKAKSEGWTKRIADGESVWDYVRVARNPLGPVGWIAEEPDNSEELF